MTYVFYIDESGTPLSHNVPIIDGQTPIFTLASLAFPLNTWRERDRSYLQLKRKYFPEKMKNSNFRNEEIEIKGNKLTSPRSIVYKTNKQYIKAVLNYIHYYNGKGFGVTFIKNHKKPTPAQSLYTQGLQVLIERFNIFLSEQPVDCVGIIVLDSRLAQQIGDRHDLTVARSHMSYIFGNNTGKYLDKIMEPPLFGDSRLSVGIQICDIFVSLLYTNHYFYYVKEIEGAIDYSNSQQFWKDLQKIKYPIPGLLHNYHVIKLNK